ncbi:MAG: hypothetical protein JOY84_20900 [Curvibacter sp.]|nr:hypothetical protein [Curvibacter sp.]
MRTPDPLTLAAGRPELEQAVRNSRRLLRRRALLGALASAAPIPGLDFAVDAALLSRLIPSISAEFGLSEVQLDRLSPERQEQVQKAVTAVGALLVGRLLSAELLLRLLAGVGLRLSASQAARYLPLAGQALSAALGFAALQALGERHIRECVLVRQALPA